MHIFLGAELYGKAQSRWFQLQKEFSERFKKLEFNEYGSELDNISIISIIMPDDFFADGAYKERKYFNRKDKAMDIRLRIDYKSFVSCNKTVSRKIYIDHILCAFDVVANKVGPDFQAQKLLADVKNILID